MAASRGLNKGRGLGALIPQKQKSNAGESGGKAPTRKGIGEEIREKTPTKQAIKRETKEKTQKKMEITPTLVKNEAAEKATEEMKSPLSGVGKAQSDLVAYENPTNDKVSADLQAGTPTEELFSLRLSSIVPAEHQPRRFFDEESILELSESIREHGVITPLIVRRKGEYYELIAGERRWRAAMKAGLKEIPAFVRDYSEQETKEIALIDNIQREDLNIIEEAEAYQRLIDEFHLRQEDIAARVSKSRSAITNTLRLLKLDPEVREMLSTGRLTMGHARALLALEDPSLQRMTAGRIAEADLSVRDTEKLVRQLLSPSKRRAPRNDSPQIEAVYAQLEEDLRKSVGTRVSIHPIRGKKGKVEIEYYSNEDLERIIDRLR